ncbi:MAG: hypothetical protein P9M14_13580 [Candidatus Alcyoniella australis]|nr:hypothetical protein [Candidatus Alcyoniella australis]
MQISTRTKIEIALIAALIVLSLVALYQHRLATGAQAALEQNLNAAELDDLSAGVIGARAVDSSALKRLIAKRPGAIRPEAHGLRPYGATNAEAIVRSRGGGELVRRSSPTTEDAAVPPAAAGSASPPSLHFHDWRLNLDAFPAHDDPARWRIEYELRQRFRLEAELWSDDAGNIAAQSMRLIELGAQGEDLAAAELTRASFVTAPKKSNWRERVGPFISSDLFVDLDRNGPHHAALSATAGVELWGACLGLRVVANDELRARAGLMLGWRRRW